MADCADPKPVEGLSPHEDEFDQTRDDEFPESFITLLDATRARDQHAESRLIARLSPIVWRFAYKRASDGTNDPAAFAEDVAQETLLKLSQRWSKCRATTDGQFIAWVLVVARRCAVDVYRREIRHLAWSDAGPDYERALQTLSLVAWRDTLHRHSSSFEIILRILEQVLRARPPETVTLLGARIHGGLTWPAIGDQLGTTASAAKRRFQRAQAGIRRAVLSEVQLLPGDKRALAFRALRVMDRRCSPSRQVT